MSVLANLAERTTARTWSPEDVTQMLGGHTRTCVAHAADGDVRSDAASGGAVSALLLTSLESGAIDGALVCVSAVEDGKVRARYRLATTREEVLAARGSTYVLGDFVGEAVPLIESLEGRLAVVGLPCELTALSKRPELADKVAFTVALFCGHATEPELVDAITERLAAEAGSPLTAFRFRRGHWRGQMSARFEDGSEIEKPFSAYSLYQNLYYFCAKKCLYCGDHFGYDADVSAGDLWTQAFKDDPIKHTALIVRTPVGAEATSHAQQRGVLETSDVPATQVLDGQRRAAPFHYNVTARHEAGESLGVKIPSRDQRVRWHERQAAKMAIKNYLATQTPEGRDRVLATSRRWLKIKLYVFKGLESLS